MERDFAGARLSPDGYRRLAEVCRGDKRFPSRWEDWEALVHAGTQKAQADDRQADEILVDVDEFLVWCRRVAVHPCFDALRAYLILHRRGTELYLGQYLRGDNAPASQPQRVLDDRAENKRCVDPATQIRQMVAAVIGSRWIRPLSVIRAFAG